MADWHAVIRAGDARVSHVQFVPSRAMYGSLSWAQRRTFKRLPADAGGKYAGAGAKHAPFVSVEEHIEHEHHFKIVSTSFVPVDKRYQPISMYEYSVSSSAHRLEPPFVVAGEKHDGPIVRLSYDVSPMQVIMEERRKPLLDSFLGMCAILGGVYTCSALLESLLQVRPARLARDASSSS